MTLTKSQFDCFSEYVIQHKTRIARAVILALYGGLRIGEVCGLKWEDIDLENRVLYIRHTVIRLKKRSSIKYAKNKLESKSGSNAGCINKLFENV